MDYKITYDTIDPVPRGAVLTRITFINAESAEEAERIFYEKNIDIENFKTITDIEIVK